MSTVNGVLIFIITNYEYNTKKQLWLLMVVTTTSIVN